MGIPCTSGYIIYVYVGIIFFLYLINCWHYLYVLYMFFRHATFFQTSQICAETHNPALSIVRYFENTSKTPEGFYGGQLHLMPVSAFGGSWCFRLSPYQAAILNGETLLPATEMSPPFFAKHIRSPCRLWVPDRRCSRRDRGRHHVRNNFPATG